MKNTGAMWKFRILKNFLISVVIALLFSAPSFGDGDIVLDTKSPNRLNPAVFGVNLLGYDQQSYEINAPFTDYFMNYGAGIWDPVKMRPDPEGMKLLAELHPTFLRFPGGCGSHYYHWKSAIGKERRIFKFGLDEFLSICGIVGATPIITLSYFADSDQDILDLMGYLNADPATNKWAKQRSLNGHTTPYGVVYFEFGNEIYHGDHRNVKKVNAEDYAKNYLRTRALIKSVSPNAQLGLVTWQPQWNKCILGIVKDQADFLILHKYAHKYFDDDNDLRPDLLFPLAFESSGKVLGDLIAFDKEIKRYIPNFYYKMAITEYNTGFVKESPCLYRRTLGAGLITAEMIFSFVNLSDRLLASSFWHFSGGGWGLIDFVRINKKIVSVTRRPSFYAFKLIRDHLKDYILRSPQGDDHDVKLVASMSLDENHISIIVINKNLTDQVSKRIHIKNFRLQEIGNAWVLNGPAIDATNEKKHDNVKVTHKRFKVTGHTSHVTSPNNTEPITNNQETLFRFEYTFEPHSLTAIEIDRSLE